MYSLGRGHLPRFFYVIGNCVDSSLSPRSTAKGKRKQFPRQIAENKYARSAFCSFARKIKLAFNSFPSITHFEKG